MKINSASKILLSLFQYFNARDIEYCVLGNAAQLPDVIDGDVDIVISTTTFASIALILSEFSNQVKCDIVQELKHEVTASYYVLSMFDSNNQAVYLHPDICSDYYRNSRLLIKAKDILQSRFIAKSKEGGEKKFYIASPEVEFIYYLIKKSEKGSIDQEQYNHIKSQYLQMPTACEEISLRYFSRDEVDSILSALESCKVDRLFSLLPELKHSLIDEQKSSWVDVYNDLARKIKRIVQPTGLIVAFLGPDGAGKTAIGMRMESDLAPAFRGVSRFHLKPGVLRRHPGVGGVNVENPHSKPSRGAVASILKLMYFLGDYILGFSLRVFPLKIRSHLVIFDRYFHDLLIDPVRYRYGAPKWIAQFFGLLIPKPDIFIVLDAPADVIQARKQEVPMEETERQRKAYLDFATGREDCIVLDTSVGIDETAYFGNKKVLEFMENRLAERMKIR